MGSYSFKMKFVTAIAAGVVASSALAQAEDTRYALLQKQYEALAPRLEEMGFGEIGSFGMGNLGPITGLNKLDTNALRAAAMNALADGDFAKAQQYGCQHRLTTASPTSQGCRQPFGQDHPQHRPEPRLLHRVSGLHQTHLHHFLPGANSICSTVCSLLLREISIFQTNKCQ